MLTLLSLAPLAFVLFRAFSSAPLLTSPSENDSRERLIFSVSPPGLSFSTNALRVHRIGDARNRAAAAYNGTGLG